MSDERHRVLRRYLRKERIDPEIGPTAEQFRSLLDRLNRSYVQMDQDRYTLERSLEISSTEMRSLHDEAEEDRLRLAEIVASLPQAVLDLDQELRVRFANTVAATLIAAEPGAALDDVVTLRDGTGNRVPMDALRDLLQGGRVMEPDGVVVARGVAIDASWLLSPIQVAGEIVGAVFVVTDLRQLKHRERALREARVEAEVAVQAEQARAQFLANMSHELRTPLNAILGYSEMVRDDLEDDAAFPDASRDLGRVIESATYLLNLINDLLDISKVDAGKLELVPELFSLEDLLEQVLTATGPLVTRQGNALRVDGCSALLYQDRTRLTQGLLNLLSNAAKFTENGQIDLVAEVVGHQVRLSVHDTGEGIPPDRIESLFDEFTQADARVAVRRGGTGLGLALTRRFARLMGGDVGARSALGVGSSFVLEVPLDVRGVPEVTEVGHGPRVLLVDDDPATHHIVLRACERHAFTLVSAYRPSQALEVLQSGTVDAVVLDLTFPGVVSGWELLSKLREDPRTQDLPVLICSVVDEAQSRARQSGVTAWLRKPIDPAELVESLGRVTARSVSA